MLTHGAAWKCVEIVLQQLRFTPQAVALLSLQQSSGLQKLISGFPFREHSILFMVYPLPVTRIRADKNRALRYFTMVFNLFPENKYITNYINKRFSPDNAVCFVNFHLK